MRVRLSQKAVDALRYKGKRDFVWDTATPGFGVEIAARSRTYVVKYRAGETSKRVQLGDVAAHSLEDARAKAMEILGSAKQGRDLLHKHEGEAISFRTMCERWIKHSRPDGRPRSPATITDYQDRCKRLIYPKIGDKLLPDVSTTDVQALLASFGDQERNRSYVLTIIRAVYNFAVASKALPKGSDNPADAIKVTKIKKPKRNLSADEIERFGVTLAAMVEAKEVTPWLAGLLRVSLLCGLRPGEAQSLKWSEVDLGGYSMNVVGKVGRRSVPLTQAAVDALKAVPRVEKIDWVFVGRVHGQHIVGVAKQLDRIAARAGVQKLTPYTFRHSAASQALASGADVRAVQALLGHTDLQTTAGYLHTTDDRNRKAAENVAAFGKAMVPARELTDDDVLAE